MTRHIDQALNALAREYLPADIAERWIRMLRPAAKLDRATGQETVAGQLYGLPKLPSYTEWPTAGGDGPLNFIASVDCAALPLGALDIALPTDGTLSFFCWLEDGEPNDEMSGRVLHIPAGTNCTERNAPDRTSVFSGRTPLSTRVEMTWPNVRAVKTRAAFAPEATEQEWSNHPLCATGFIEALEDLYLSNHHVGGHAMGYGELIEGSSVLRDDMDEQARSEEPGMHHDTKGVGKAQEWLLLAQIDTVQDGEDCGILCWFIRGGDLAQQRFDRARFSWGLREC